MPATKTAEKTDETTQVHPLVAGRRAQVKRLTDASTSGVKADARVRINLIELELSSLDVPFEPYVAARKTAEPDMTDETLVARIQDVRRVVDAPNTSASIRKTGERVLAKLTAERDARGISE
jgi:hypothetical protein